MTVSSQQFQTSFTISFCDANRAIFLNYVQPRISPQRFASAPVFPPMRSRSGSKYAFGNQHTSNRQHVDVFIARIQGEKSCDSTRANYFTSSSEIHLSFRNSVHELHNELLPPQFASLLFFLKLSSEKTRPTTK